MKHTVSWHLIKLSLVSCVYRTTLRCGNIGLMVENLYLCDFLNCVYIFFPLNRLVTSWRYLVVQLPGKGPFGEGESQTMSKI